MSVPRSPALLALALLLAAPARAQLLHTFSGQHPGERVGWALAGVEDVDGDGIADLALGVPFAPVGSVQVGTVELRSGADGALLRTLDGDAALDHAGWAVAGLGDLDGDGRGDLAVGLPDSDLAQLDAGCVRVVSGASGTTLRQHLGLAAGEGLGSALAPAGDCDGDGVTDLLIGAWRADAAGADAGRVELRSGRTGALLRQHVGLQVGDRLGIALSGLGDVDGDGRDDYALGADQGGQGPGYVRVHSGRTGALLRQHVGAGARDALGAALAGLGDVDGDLRDDYALGAPRAAAAAGRVLVISGASGLVLHELEGEQAGDELGRALCGGFDLDQDGAGDLLVGAPFAAGGHGAARVLSGAHGGELSAWPGSAGGDRMGQAVATLGDLDGDGAADLALGAPREDLVTLDGGVVRVVSGAKVCAPTPYCTGKLNSQGCVPSVDWSGNPTLSGPDDFVVVCRQVLSNKNGIAFWGLAPSALPALGGTLCVAPPLQRGPALASGGNPPPEDCSGVLAWPVPQAFLAAHGWAPGTTLHVQFWSRDPAHPDGTGVSLSDALRFELCP
jgi:hypothetical protein